jgi:hypothetical protein
LPGISLASKPGAAQPAKNGPAPAAESANDVAIKQSIEELKKIVDEPLKQSATELEQVLKTAWTRIGYNQGALYGDAQTLAKKAQSSWDTAKAKAIAAKFDRAITELSPEHPQAEKLLASVLRLVDQEMPAVRLFLPKTNEALQHTKDLVQAKQEAHKQALAAKEAQKKKDEEQKKQQGGSDKDKKHDPGPKGDDAGAHGGGGGATPPVGGGGKDAHGAPDAKDPKKDGGAPPVAPGGGKDAKGPGPAPAPPEHADKGHKPEDAKPAPTAKAEDKTKAADPAAKNAAPAPEKPPAAPEPTPEELLEKFRSALTKKDAAAAVAAWQKVPPSHRGLLSPEDVVHGYVLAAKLGEEMHKASTNPFAVNFALLESAESAKALEAVHSTGQWNAFVLLAPTQSGLTKKHQKALRPLVGKDKQTAQELFGKAFVPAHDGPYPGRFGPTTQATPWSHGALVRLWDALVTAGLPSAHIGAASGGMYLVAKEMEKGKWIESTGAWYDDGIKACAFGTGAVAYNANLDANKDKKEAHNANEGYMPFFEGSALHEVGHAVGASFGGDDWAVQRNDFKAENGNSWSQALFNYTGTGGSKFKNFFKGVKTVKPDDMRAYMIGKINGVEALPPNVKDEAAAEAAAKAEYKDTLLYKYMMHLRTNGQGYQFPEIEQCVHNGRIYYENATFKALGFPSRFVSCKAETITARVSVYSLASHKEWFAENYMAYYKTPQALGSKVAGDVKSYLDAVHKNPAAGKIAQAGGGGASPGKSKAEKQTSEGGGKAGADEQAAQDESVATAKQEQLHRFSFPVNLG